MTKNNAKLPNEWEWVKLSDIGKIISGGTPSTAISEYWEGSINWIAPSDLTGYKNIRIKSGKKSITELGLKKSSARLMPKGSVLFSCRAPIGYTVIADEELCTNQGFKSIIPFDFVDSLYIYYFLKASKQDAEKVASGTTFKEISLKSFSELSFPLPPLNIQQAIVSKIEELFSELDKGIEDLKTAQQQLKTYRQSVLKWAFEGKLTNENAKDGELPKDWKFFKIGEVCKTIDGDRGPNYPKKEEFSKEGYCLYLSTKNVREDRFLFEETIFITKEKDERLRSGKLQKNDVIITTRGTLGNVALYDNKVPFEHVRINSGMLILRILNENLYNYYLMKFITSPVFINQLKNMQTGTAQPQIPANILREIEISLPPTIEEQHLIVQEIESRLSVADKMEESIAQSLQQSEALRQSILKKAFSGELV